VLAFPLRVPGRWSPARWSQGAALPQPSFSVATPTALGGRGERRRAPPLALESSDRAYPRPGWRPIDESACSAMPAPPAQTRQKPRRGSDATAEVLSRAEALGLTGPLGAEAAPPGASCGGSFARHLEAQLRSSAADAWDTPRLSSALTWVGPFMEATGRTFFVPAFGHSQEADAGKQWNRRSLDLFTKFITSSAPIGAARGEHVSQATAKSYSQQVYLLRCREADYDVAPSDVGGYAGKGDGKTTKRKEPPAAERALGAGLRAVHLTAAAAAGFDRTTERGEIEWCAAIGGHNLLLRGGELGTPDNARHEPRRVLRGRHFSWRSPNRASRERLWLLVWVIPIKDPEGNHKGYPIPVARRHDGPLGSDPLCAYDAFAKVYWRMGMTATRREPLPVDPLGRPVDGWWLRELPPALLEAPFFTRPSGAVWTSADSSHLFKRIAVAAGLDPGPIGGKAVRIGGSTDAKESTGEAGKAIIKRRGRWASDVAEVYQRELLGIQLDLSTALGNAVGEDLEALCEGWAQPVHV
jgi:hypothetical protein